MQPLPEPGAAVAAMRTDTWARLQALLRVPAPLGADAHTRAAFFQERAGEFDQIGAQDPAYACEAAEFAQADRDKADRIRAGGVA